MDGNPELAGRNTVKELVQLRRTYFLQARASIAKDNINALFVASLGIGLLSGFFLFLTPLLLPGWHFSNEYIPLIPLCVAFFIPAAVYRGRSQVPFTIAQALSILFVLAMGLNLIAIGVFPYPSDPDSLFPLYLALIPALFILKQSQIISLTGALAALDIILTIRYKDSSVISHDVFTVVAAFVFSASVSFPIHSSRLKNFKVNKTLQDLSDTDSLSGIWNKQKIETEVREFIDSEPEGVWAVAILDVDDFKRVNDVHGHDKGDKVVASIGSQLKGIQKGGNFVAGRIGGDEFIVLCKDCKTDKNPVIIFEKLRTRISSAIKENADIDLTISVGLFISEESTQTSFEHVFKNADRALYEAKDRGKNICVAY